MTRQKQAKLEQEIRALKLQHKALTELCQRVFEAFDNKEDLELPLRAVSNFIAESKP